MAMLRDPGGAGHSWPPAAGIYSWSLKQSTLREEAGPLCPLPFHVQAESPALQTWASDPGSPETLCVNEKLGET